MREEVQDLELGGGWTVGELALYGALRHVVSHQPINNIGALN